MSETEQSGSSGNPGGEQNRADDAALIVMDEAGKVAEWNPRAEAMFGWRREAAIGRELGALIVPERMREAHNLGFRRFLQTGHGTLLNQRLELTALRRDGGEFQVEVTISETADNGRRRFTAIARDLDGARAAAVAAEAEARNGIPDSESKFRDLFEESTDAVTIVGLDGNFVEVNREFSRLTGIPREEAIGKRPGELGIFTDRLEASEVGSSVRAGGRFRREVSFRARDGTVGWGVLAARLATLAGRQQIIATVHDIGPLKRAERILAESEEKFRKIFEEAPLGISMIAVADGRFLDVNREFERMSGFSRGEIVGKTMAELGRARDQRIVERAIADTLASGAVHDVEIEAATKDGEMVPILFSGTISEIRGQRCMVGFVRDITDRKRLESALVEAGQTAMAAAQSKAELLAWMSHEVRTPMNALLGMADLLWDTQLAPPQREYVRVFRSTGHSLLNLVDGILDLSRAEAGLLTLEATAFNLRELIDGVVEILALRAQRKGLALLTQVDRDVPAAVIGDPLRLRQVLVNIVENAIKFTEKGQVNIRVGLDGAPPAIRFSVIDTGIGIPADKLDSIFLRFTQVERSTARKYGGSGLGLSIARTLIDLMGGKIRAESRPGDGSTFHLAVPLKPAPAGAEPAAIAAISAASAYEPPAAEGGGPRRILLAEDSEDNCFLVESYLRGTPCALDIAENGEIALRKFRAADYDLVLMDMQMPVLDGYATVEAIRRFERDAGRRATPIVALTACALPEDLERGRAAGCDAFLTKPIRKSTLLEAVREFTHDRG
jgi:PAS domain S-box-containing protein